MTVVSYHSTLISDFASQEEAADKTSSQIFLSRGVAGTEAGQAAPAPAPRSPSPTFVMSVFESESRHVMNLGDATAKAKSTVMANDSTRAGQSRLHQDCVEGKHSVASDENILLTGVEATTGSRRMSDDHPTTLMRSLESTVERIEDTPEDGIIPSADKGKGKEVDRGRTLERGPRYPNPLEKAESRPRNYDPTIELDVQSIEKRQISRSSTFSNFEDPKDPCAILEDNLLEPCPHLSIRNSVSEVLSASESSDSLPGGLIHGSTWSFFETPGVNHPRPARTLTTVFSDCHPVYPAPVLPPESLPKSRPDIDQLENIATSSSTPLWSTSEATPNVRAIDLSQASRLPTEILQQIFYNLAPADFNSARHSCRSWLIKSLDRSLLETMLKRAGFSNRITPSTVDQQDDTGDGISIEWSMSKTLALECALGPDWTGNGLARDCTSESSDSAFVETSRVDFTEVAVHYPGQPLSVGTIFTISSCSRFLMVANGCLVYLYELNRSHKITADELIISAGELRPVTSIICPGRVLACSMDTSSNRYAVAILLDGRMGLVCDVNASLASSPAPTTGPRTNANSVNVQSPDRPSEARVRGTSFLDRVSLRTSAWTANPNHQSKEPPFVFPGIATTGASFAPVDRSDWQDVFSDDVPDHIRTAGPSSRHGSLPRANAISPEGEMEHSFSSDQDRLPNFMPIENGPRSLYRNLCSDDDPPRSVAICPQRRCVAFGCSSGIELHWVDALTGQDLNRWFPLTAPSDFLFFLPPRKSIDSAKKLRLISSAARPGERPAIAERPFGARTKSSPFWERFPVVLGQFDNSSDADLIQGSLSRLRGDVGRSSLTGRMDCSDHYRAIPLSDGYHILFTDPSTGLLCLGSDAPVGGPTKLLRKIWFQGPKGEGSPLTYAAGANLSCGVRIVAAFGNGTEQTIWLFSVPRDVFATNQGGQSPLSASSYLRSKSGQENSNSEWINWWPDDGLQEWLNNARDPVAGILPRSVWPVKVRGQPIGTCSGLVDLTIDAGSDMTIWAFDKHGIATVWNIDVGRNEAVKRRCVMRDGTVREIDSDGDVEMIDARSPSPDILQHPTPLVQESYDGAAFSPTMQANPVYDSEGHLLMDEMTQSSQFDDEDIEPADQEMLADVWYHGDGWTNRLFRRPVVDLVEEVTGVSRIDVEIR